MLIDLHLSFFSYVIIRTAYIESKTVSRRTGRILRDAERQLLAVIFVLVIQFILDLAEKKFFYF